MSGTQKILKKKPKRVSKKEDSSQHRSTEGRSNFLEETIKNFTANLMNKDNTVKIKSRNFNQMMGKTESSMGSQGGLLTDKYIYK